MHTASDATSVEPIEQTESKRSLWWKPSWQKRKRMLHIEAWIFVSCAYTVVIFAYVWPQDYRNTDTVYVAASWTAAIVRTFIFHIGIVIVLIAIGAGVARRWKLLIATVPMLVFSVGPAVVSYWPTGVATANGKPLKVMSINLLFINQETEAIIDQIAAELPDVLLVQEYTSHWDEALTAGIGRLYPHACTSPREDSFGTAIYSKIPFVEKPNLRVPLGQATEPQIRAVIDFEGKPIALYNIHLLPPWGMEYTIEHRSQFADLLDVLKTEKLPAIVGGDFNFTENSANAADLKTIGFTDAHDQGGQGRGATWPVNSFFSLDSQHSVGSYIHE